MRKYTIEATEENVLESMEHDVLNRSEDVRDFITMLDMIDYNAFISVDAAWGEGKTFFVRQVELTMKYYNKKVFKKGIGEEEKTAFQGNKVLGNLQLEHTYLPIYFDAWLYDNHVNALMALLMVAIKQSGKLVDTTQKKDNMASVASILDSIRFWNSSNWSNLLETTRGEDILKEALLLDEVRQKVKDVFHEILAEEAEKLVIFIDELDRCKPTFAIEILESIKHYFDDERILFVVSVNKSQLIHTISRYYGEQFDSTRYLNKFFDVNIQLPKANTKAYFDQLGLSTYENYWMKKLTNELQTYYSLSLRDTTRYFQKIVSIQEKWGERMGSDSWKVLTIFIPVICVLDIVDVAKKQRFLSGNGFDILEETILRSDVTRRFIVRLSGHLEESEENYQSGLKELKAIYEFVFRDAGNGGWYSGRIEIYSNLKRECLRICNNL